MEHNCVPDRIRDVAGFQGNRVRGESGVDFAVRIRGDVAEIAGVMRDRIGRSVHHAGRIEVTAGVRAVVAAIAFLVDVKAVRSGRDAGQIDLHVDISVAGVRQIYGPFRGLPAARLQRGH